MKRYSEEEVRDLVGRTARLRNADVAELEKREEYLNGQVKLLEELSAGFEEVLDNFQKESVKLLDRIDHLEGLYWKLWGENEQLRELVKEMYVDLCTARPSMTVFEEANPYMERLEQLGFWDGEQ